jgi:hypothetical protein
MPQYNGYLARWAIVLAVVLSLVLLARHVHI